MPRQLITNSPAVMGAAHSYPTRQLSPTTAKHDSSCEANKTRQQGAFPALKSQFTTALTRIHGLGAVCFPDSYHHTNLFCATLLLSRPVPPPAPTGQEEVQNARSLTSEMSGVEG